MKNDKQKLMILGALGVVMLGVGAFSFMGGSSAPAPAPVKKQEPEATNTGQTETTMETGSPATAATGTASGENSTAVDPKTGQPVATGEPGVNNAITPGNEVSVLVDPEAVRVSQLTARDPFNGARWDPLEAIKPVSTPTTNPVSQPQPRPRPRTSINKGGGFGKIGPVTLDPGSLNPVDGGGQIGINQNGMPSLEEVPYKVNGIVRGSNSAAIVTDQQGRQRIARVGSDLDPDTKLLGVENGKMIVRHRGKVKTVSINDAGAPDKGNKPPQNQ